MTQEIWSLKPHIDSEIMLQILSELILSNGDDASLFEREGWDAGEENYNVQLSWKDECLNCWQKAHQSEFFKCQKAI